MRLNPKSNNENLSQALQNTGNELEKTKKWSDGSDSASHDSGESRLLLRLALDAAELTTWEWDFEKNLAIIDKRWPGLLGYTEAEMPPTFATFNRLIHPGDKDRVLSAIRAQLQGESDSIDVEYRLRAKDSSWRWFFSKGKIMKRSPDGRPLKMYGISRDINKRKQALQAIEDLARFPEENPGPVMRVSSDNIILYANPAGAPVLEAWQTAQGGKLPDYIFDKVVESRSSNQNQDMEIKCADRIYWFRINRASADQFINIYGLDITERKRAEEAYRDLVENINDVIYTMDTTGVLTYVSPVMKQALGEDPSGYIGHPFTEFVYSDDLARIKKRFGEALNNIIVPDEFRIVTKAGKIFWVRTSSRPITEKGKIIGLQGVLENITERKKAEEELRQRENDFRLLFNSLPGTFVLYELEYAENGQPRDAKIVEINDIALSRSGRRRDEMLGRGIYEILPALPEGLLKKMDQVARSQKSTYLEFASIVTDHRYELHLYSPGPNKCAVIGLDITERKRAEEALRDSEEKFRTAFENASIGRSLTALDGGLLQVNRAFCELVGYTMEELTSTTYATITHPDDVALAAECVRCLLTGEKEVCHFDKRYIHKDGRVIFVSINSFLLRDSAGNPLYFVTDVIDITERKKAEEALEYHMRELMRANEELQRFAYVASHDLQEPLRMISVYMQLLEKRYKDKLDQDANEFIDFAVGGAKRMQNMILSLLEYSRVNTRGNILTPVSMEDILWDVMDDMQFALEESGAMITHDHLPEVMGDRSQLSRLLLNLLANSIKFRSQEKPRIHISAKIKDGQWLFSVKDNGIGIDPKYHERIFVIFQRLHGYDYPGTGIGLSVAKRIVERHGGTMSLESEIGKGATFYFTLSPVNPREKSDMIAAGAGQNNRSNPQ